MKHRKPEWKTAYRAVIRIYERLAESFGQIQARSPETKYTAFKCQKEGCEEVYERGVKGFRWCEAHYLNFLHDNPDHAKQFTKWNSKEKYAEQPGRKTANRIDPVDLKIDIERILDHAKLKGYQPDSEAYRRYSGQRFIRSGIYNLIKGR